MFGKNNVEPDMELYTIYDSKSRSYELPTFAKNKEVMLREIANMFRDPSQAKNRFLVNAEDYSIFKIATYDRSTGKIQGMTLEHVANLHDIRAMVEPMLDFQRERPTNGALNLT